MADEVTSTTTLRINKPGISVDLTLSESGLSDMVGDHYHNTVMNVGTGAAGVDIAKGDVGTPGRINLLNLDPDNYVEIGKTVSGAFEAFAVMEPGEPWQGRPAAGVTLKLRANTATCKVKVFMSED